MFFVSADKFSRTTDRWLGSVRRIIKQGVSVLGMDVERIDVMGVSRGFTPEQWDKLLASEEAMFNAMSHAQRLDYGVMSTAERWELVESYNQPR